MLSMLLEAAIRSLVLGGIAWAALTCLRVKNPITRLTVWTGMLYVAIAMPLLVVARHALLPAMPVLPAVPMPPSVDAMIAGPAPAPLPMPMPIPSSAGTLPAGAGEASYTLWPMILTLYGAVALLLLLRLGIGLVRGWALKRRAAPLGDGHYVSGEVATPLVFGSAIILPADHAAWPEAKRVAVLAHERSHIERGDFYNQLFAGAHRAIFWFSPLGWLLHRELAALAELASDDAAAQAHGDRLSYAEILMEVARDARPLASGVAMARGPLVSRRIRRLVSGAALSMSLSHRQRAMIGGAGTLAVLGALMATVATSSVASTVTPQSAPSTPKSRFAPLMATLAKLDNGPAQLADAVDALLQGVSPTAAAAPEAPPASDATAGLTTVSSPSIRTFITGGRTWGDQGLTNTGPGEGVPTLSEIRTLSPQMAGERVLGKLTHAPVASIRDMGGNFGLVYLIENWTSVPQGCRRLRWMANFLLARNSPPDSAYLSSVASIREIGLATSNGCEDAQVASTNVDVDTGLKVLGMVDEIATGKREATFECKSLSVQNMCSNAEAVRAELTRTTPGNRLVQSVDGNPQVYYPPVFSRPGVPPTTITVRFDAARQDHATVTVEDIPIRTPAPLAGARPPLPPRPERNVDTP